MGTETRFLFETDFGNPQLSESTAQIYSEDDIQAAKAEALQAARAELRNLEEKRAADILAEMSAKLDTLSAQRAEDLQSATERGVDIAIAICQRILPALATQNALAEIEGHIVRTLADVHGEPRVVVRVSEENLGKLQSCIDSLASGFDGKIVLLADDQLSVTDCHVMWADGGSERDVQRTLAQINKAVEQITDNGIGPATADPGAGSGHDTASGATELTPDLNDLEQSSQAID
jgi:flagellar assembly protein FliH